MKFEESHNPMSMAGKQSSRRKFLGTVTVAASLSGLMAPFAALSGNGHESFDAGELDNWISKIKGKHRMVFDVTQPHDILPFAWPKVFLMTNEATGSTETDCCAVVVLRHDAIPYAMESSLWAKYNFGEVFHAPDPKNGNPATRNPFWKPAPGDFMVPGIGEVAIGIDQLQKNGVMFCVCDAAMTVYSTALAEGMGIEPATVKAEWVKGLLPGIQVVPSGIWALGRAQENGCGYIFTG